MMKESIKIDPAVLRKNKIELLEMKSLLTKRSSRHRINHSLDPAEENISKL